MSDTLEIFGTEYTGVTGIKATDNNNQIKTYIRPVGTKTINANGTGIDVAEYATVDVSISGGSVSLQDKTVSITPSSSAQTQVVSADSGYDGLDEVTINVSATPTSNDFVVTINNINSVYTPNKTFTQIIDAYEDDKNVVFICDDFSPVTAFYDQEEAMIFCTILVRQEDSEERAYIEQRVYTYTSQSWSLTNTESVYYTDITTTTVAEVAAGAIFVNEDGYVEGTATRRSSSDLSSSGAIVTAPAGYYASASTKAVTAGSEGTPVATKGTVSNHSISVTPSVINTVGYIIGGTKTGTAVSVSASELVSGTYSITGTGNSNVTNYAYASVSAGSAGTPTATKGTVSNHSVSITPSVTNTTGWITGSTKTGTAVSVSASELVSGSTTLTSNGTYDITNLEEAIINVEGSGGGGELTVASATKTLSAAANSISFTGLSGNPTSFVITSSAEETTGGTKVVAVAYDGSSLYGMDITTQMTDDTGFSKSYSSGTLTVTASSASFQANTYKLVYTYGGSSSDVKTEDVQVGSGATSITFTGLSGEPSYFSCVFKSDFSTSSGYQRVIDVVFDGSSIYGNAMDSSAKALTSWTKSYSNGSLTITSTGTNNGGYFHQPGYYQLTYVTGGSSDVLNLQTKTVTPTSSASTITADSGYDGLEKVVIEGVLCSNLSASNIKSGVVVNIGTATDSDSIASVTGTYSAGGGASNFVSSTFTTKSTGASTETITVPYTGTGYPIGLVITILGGAYNSSISPWYNNTTRYAVGQWSGFKSVMTSTPTYGTSGTQNQSVTAWIYKNSTSTATSYSRSSAMNTVVYNSGNATGSGANCVRIKSSTSFQYITGNGGSSSYGLLASQTYRYYMIYSS